MKKYFKIITLLSFCVSILLMSANLFADIHPDAKEKLKNELQSAPMGVMDLKETTVSNIEVMTTNYGIFGLNVPAVGTLNAGGGFWPRGSVNQYIFGGGIWFGCKKYLPGVEEPSLLCSVTYNPYSAKGWYVPGRIYEAGPQPEEIGNYNMDADFNDRDSYRVYLSTDYSKANGEAIITSTDDPNPPNWPIWDAGSSDDTLKLSRYFGHYIEDQSTRNMQTYPRGPGIISGEDIFSTFKDTDLSRYEEGPAKALQKGYPLYLQMEHMIYSWGFGDYRDFIFLLYNITNYSDDTLIDCWLAPIIDVDLGRLPYTSWGASNDRTKWYDCDESLNMAVQWSGVDNGERGFGFGYLGYDFLESPSVIEYGDTTGYKYIIDGNDTVRIPIIEKMDFNTWKNEYKGKPGYEAMPNSLRKDKKWYYNEEQLGLVSMNNWNIAEDKILDADRYNYLSTGNRDGDNGPGDKRFMMATGPFHVLPTDTFRTVVGIIITTGSKGGDPDGTCEDMVELERKDRFAQEVYDNNFQAPLPPDPAQFLKGTTGLNHATTLKWDLTSEMSADLYERGLDFMGYKLYRARRSNLDSFATTEIAPSINHPLGKGPLGWKQVARWSVQTPFRKSIYAGGGDKSIAEYGFDVSRIDNYFILGPAVDGNGNIDSMAIRVMRQPRNFVFSTPEAMHEATGLYIPRIAIVDSTGFIGAAAPWHKVFSDIVKNDDKIAEEYKIGPLNYFNYEFEDSIHANITSINDYDIFDDIVGDFVLSPTILTKGYNPLYFKETIEEVSPTWVLDTIGSKSYFANYIVGDTITHFRYDTLGNIVARDTVRIDIDTIYYPSTLQPSGSSSTGWVMTIETPYVVDSYWDLLKDTAHIQRVQEFLYGAITNLQIKAKEITLSDFSGSEVAKMAVMGAMKEYTNDRTFVDIGDDNGDNYIDFQENPLVTEKLVNNMNYHYKLIAFDEGDFTQPTPRKDNVSPPPDKSFGKNSVTVVPVAAPIGLKTKFEIISKTDDKLGSLNNFNMYAVDMQKVQQTLAGDTLRLQFDPYWRVSEQLLPGMEEGREPLKFGTYSSIITLINESYDRSDPNATPDTLYRTNYYYEIRRCNATYSNIYSENAASVAWKKPDAIGEDIIFTPSGDTARIDSVYFQLRSNREIRQRNGEFSSGTFKDPLDCYPRYWYANFRGLIEFDFDFTMRQYGGVLRPDTAVVFHAKDKGAADAFTPVYPVDEAWDTEAVAYENMDNIKTTQFASFDYTAPQNLACGFNNGPGVYKITFKEGGSENIKMAAGAPEYLDNFETPVDYLTMDVENVYEYNRFDISGDSATVKYPGLMSSIAFPLAKFIDMKNSYLYSNTVSEEDWDLENPFPRYRLFPDPRNLGQVDTNSWDNLSTNEFIGKYNISSYAWFDRRSELNRFQTTRAKFMAVSRDKIEDNQLEGRSLYQVIKQDTLNSDELYKVYSGLKQNRYYLSKKVGTQWLDFTHELQVNGCSFALDYANAAAFTSARSIAGFTIPMKGEYYEDTKDADGNWIPRGRDFQAGDVIYVGVTGGAAGFPLPNANVRFVVNTNNTDTKYTDDVLDDIKIVPNPYYISHQGQASPYDAKIYFTKLPPECTIGIYTSSGQLVRELENNETAGSNDGVIEWNLLNQNGQRVQSQPLIAIIETPDGARTIQNFSIVQGGFKIITDF